MDLYMHHAYSASPATTSITGKCLITGAAHWCIQASGLAGCCTVDYKLKGTSDSQLGYAAEATGG